MKFKLLLSGAMCTLLSLCAIGQQSGNLQQEIIQKEKELAAAAASTRSVYEATSSELVQLYEVYRDELEKQLNVLPEGAERAEMEQEHKELLEKMKKYTSPKRN